jgi:hypothetical protein
MVRDQPVTYQPSMAGTLVTFTAPTANGDAVSPGVYLHIKNGHTVPTVLTFQTGGTADGLAIADPTLSIANGTEVLVGPIPGGVYPQTTGADKGKVLIDYSVINVAITRAVINEV